MARRPYKNTPAPPLAATGVTRLAVEAITAVPGDWRASALCAQSDPEAFFPSTGEDWRPAVRVCQRCEVREPCLRYALEEDVRDGIWGGLTQIERERLRPKVEQAPNLRRRWAA